MHKKMWLWFLLGWVVGSYFGLSHVLSMFGSKKS
jgi:hypothetical protein